MMLKEGEPMDTCLRDGCWNLVNGDNVLCVKHRALEAYHDKSRDANWLAARNRLRVELKAKYKKQVYKHYGDKCACCGAMGELYLTLDHVINDGHHDRRLNGDRSRVDFYRTLIKRGYSDNLQLLCANCNHGKQMNFGICPHKQEIDYGCY